MENLDGMSMDIEKNEREKLKSVFPECFIEDKLDIDKLLNMCGEYITDDFERYEFKWKGKSECLQLAQKRTTGTLRPCKEESVDFDTTKNLYIEGDNLEVLKILQTSYYRKVKMIYIDPPYNTGNDFVYDDDFTDPIAKYKEVTSQATKSNPENMGRFHTAWLNMMYPRLRLAANLLRDDGVCFISIDDHEVHNLRKICDEVFGEENFRNIITVRRYDKNINKQFVENGLPKMNVGLEYILMYSKYPETKFSPVYRSSNEERSNFGYWKGFWNNADRPTMRYSILGVTPETGQWKWKKEIADEAITNYAEFMERFSDKMTIEEYWIKTGKSKRFIRRNENGKGMNKGVEHWIAPADGILRNSNWSDVFASKPTGTGVPYSNPKNVELIKDLIKLSGAEDTDLVIDFFSGSATTGHSIMEFNKEHGQSLQFILVQLPEDLDSNYQIASATEKAELKEAIDFLNTINKPHYLTELGKERIRRAGQKIKNELEESNSQLKIGEEPKVLPDIGFRVFKLDTSNNRAWHYDEKFDENLFIKRLNSMVDRVKPDRTDLDMVYEVILKLGLKLTEPVEKLEFYGKISYSVGENCLILICLDKDVEIETVKKMAELAPAQIIFGQNSLKDLSAVSNAKFVLRDLKIEMKFV